MRHCPICNGAPINDRPDLPAMQHTCSLCGWHYSAAGSSGGGESTSPAVVINAGGRGGAAGMPGEPGRVLTFGYDGDGYPEPETPAAMAERARLSSLHRARRTIVLEIDSLRADQEETRADALQAALDSIDHVFRMMLINARSFV